MYKNRVHRTFTNLDLQSLPRRSDIQFDERARYVEFVCNVWNEGRFGPDLAEPVTLDWSDRSEPLSFLDIDAAGQSWFDEQNESAACSAHSILGRAATQRIDAAFRRAKQMCLLATDAITGSIPAGSPSNQGRGSP